MKRGDRIAVVRGWRTDGVVMEKVEYDKGREALTVRYAVLAEEQEEEQGDGDGQQPQVELSLPRLEGWDVQLTTRSEDLDDGGWQGVVTKSGSGSGLTLCVVHGRRKERRRMMDLVRVTLVVEVASTSGVRVNGLLKAVGEGQNVRNREQEAEEEEGLLRDVQSAYQLSVRSDSGVESVRSGESSATHSLGVGGGGGQAQAQVQVSTRGRIQRTPAAHKMILSKVRRNYIYFSSLLQEPEAKWKPSTSSSFLPLLNSRCFKLRILEE